MRIHPAAKLFPLDDGDNLKELAADIQEHGQQVPIEIFEGQLLDGRRRLMACESLGIACNSVEVEPEDPIAYVVSLNAKRRHLTPAQLAFAADSARSLYDEQAKERQKATLKRGNAQPDVTSGSQRENQGKSRDHVGAVFGVSGQSVDRAKRVRQQGIPELESAVTAGKVALTRAVEISQLPRDEQPAALQEAITVKRRQRPIKPPPAGSIRGKGIRLAHEAIACLKKIPKNDALRKRGFQVVTDWIRHNK
jgi:hypothetical protein